MEGGAFSLIDEFKQLIPTYGAKQQNEKHNNFFAVMQELKLHKQGDQKNDNNSRCRTYESKHMHHGS
ncbi:hypothetical protein D3C72_2437020 [compost metagenome]